MWGYSLQCQQNIMINNNYNIDLLKVIGDFLELGHVENIVAMCDVDEGVLNRESSDWGGSRGRTVRESI